MDDELGKAVRVVLVGKADFVEVPFRRRPGARPVEQAVPKERQLTVVGRSAPAGGGVRPPAHPAGVAEFFEPVLNAPLAGEPLLAKRLAQLQHLLDGQRASVKGKQNLRIPGGETAFYKIRWHCGPKERTIPFLISLPFPLAWLARNRAS